MSWVSVILWMGIIFALSSIPDLRSGLQPLWDLVLRKVAHTLEYAILGWLIFRAFEKSGIDRFRAAVFSVLLSVFYAGTDEFHQMFVPGRHGSPLDALIDGVGIIVGVVARLRLLNR